jgi:pyruvate kinase
MAKATEERKKARQGAATALAPHRTKIICTLGPATRSPDDLRAMIEAGADVFRINFSHGTREAHAEHLAAARKAAGDLQRNVAVLLDLQGVKVRTTVCDPGPFDLATGTEVEIAGGEEPSTPARIRIAPPAALRGVRAGDRILLDDGKIQLRALRRSAGVWIASVEAGDRLSDRKGVNLPDSPTTDLPALTSKDVADIQWGVEQDVDLFALSFVRSARDVARAKKVVADLGSDIPVIAKLEKPEALLELGEILEASFGVMVARGDLGVEMPPEKVPVIQKRIIAEARRLRKPVITATQMLESMIESPVPTRAEASDVANAVFDGSDAVMLSGETSVGKFPVETVRMMARIVREAEAAMLKDAKARALSAKRTTFANAVGEAACVAAEAVGAKCIIVFTRAGYAATLVAGCRPRMPIYTFGHDARILRRLALVWGMETRLLEPPPVTLEDFLKACEPVLLRDRLVEPADPAVIVAGVPFQAAGGHTNILKLHQIGE